MLDHEELHRTLYRLHASLYRGVITNINEALRHLNAACESEDDRPKLRPFVQRLEEHRLCAEDMLRQGGRLRVDLVRVTGCDGTCETPK